jgi:hypothetical protein
MGRARLPITADPYGYMIDTRVLRASLDSKTTPQPNAPSRKWEEETY